jgi:hypothetical protein
MTEDELLVEAEKYLKRKCFETTVSMEIIENNVINGDGKLIVNCTVRFLGIFKSSWKKFLPLLTVKLFQCRQKKDESFI